MLDILTAMDWAEIGLAGVDTLLMLGGALLFTLLLGLERFALRRGVAVGLGLSGALLMVGCPRKSFSPTRLTLRSCIIDSKTTSRLMSARRRSFLFIMGTARRQGLRSWEVGVPSRPPFNNPEQRCAVCEQVMPLTGKRMSYLRSAHSSMGVPFHT